MRYRISGIQHVFSVFFLIFTFDNAIFGRAGIMIPLSIRFDRWKEIIFYFICYWNHKKLILIICPTSGEILFCFISLTLSNDIDFGKFALVVITIKMKNYKYHIVGTVPISNRKIVESGKIDTTTHIYVIAQFFGLVQALQ